MKYIVTLPALLGKYFEAEATGRLEAISPALCLTVWTEDEWLAANRRAEEIGHPFNAQKVDSNGDAIYD